MNTAEQEMTDNLTTIINAADLLANFQKKNIVLVDATNSKNAKSDYQQKHLQGALFVDLNTQLADIKDDVSLGGRHPLPSLEKFATTLAELGISSDSHVVIYDHANGANAAARFWWMLRAVGHAKVQVLNGGFREAERIGFPISGEVETSNQAEPYKIEGWSLPVSDIFEVQEVSQNKDHSVIDVRENQRYRGRSEPIDLVAGHIPGAINVPFSTNLDANQLFLPPNELKQKYQTIFAGKSAENIIVHCGSGVTACHTLLAIAYAGLAIPKLYVGSWSEWSRNGKPIATIGDQDL